MAQVVGARGLGPWASRRRPHHGPALPVGSEGILKPYGWASQKELCYGPTGRSTSIGANSKHQSRRKIFSIYCLAPWHMWMKPALSHVLILISSSTLYPTNSARFYPLLQRVPTPAPSNLESSTRILCADAPNSAAEAGKLQHQRPPASVTKQSSCCL